METYTGFYQATAAEDSSQLCCLKEKDNSWDLKYRNEVKYILSDA